MNEAMAQDDEVARSLLGSIDDEKDKGPRLSDYTPEVQRLDIVTDLLQSLIATTIAAAGGKPGRTRPAKRPETAFARAKDALILARHGSLLDEVAEAQARWSALHN